MTSLERCEHAVLDFLDLYAEVKNIGVDASWMMLVGCCSKGDARKAMLL